MIWGLGSFDSFPFAATIVLLVSSCCLLSFAPLIRLAVLLVSHSMVFLNAKIIHIVEHACRVTSATILMFTNSLLHDSIRLDMQVAATDVARAGY